MKPVLHPATFKRFQKAAEKLKLVRARNQVMQQMTLAGSLVTQFDDDELRLLDQKGFLSLNEKQLIIQSGRQL